MMSASNISSSVHGQFSFSPLEMHPPSRATETGGRLSGGDMCTYFETFHRKLLEGNKEVHTLLNTRVVGIERSSGKQQGWKVRLKHISSGGEGDLKEMWFRRVVVCTGVCSSIISL